ncbi:hypothetical protein [Lentzea sp. NPDC059081]|uniref:hypothetical protein n=1 Tax=Lentzea sp. NPDC059081 TaxID=3346719 RepID=UPI00367A6511
MKHFTKVATGAVLLAVLGLTSVAGATSAVATTASTAGAQAESRQLLGTVTGVTDFDATAPADGEYAVEYEVGGVSYWDTYVDGLELGYVGGAQGVYRTRSLTLTAGCHLVRVAGPEGWGSAKVYLVRL